MSDVKEFVIPSKENKVVTMSRSVNSYFTTIGSNGIGAPEDHAEQIEVLRHANEGDLFACTISSCPGGSYSGLLALKNAIETTDAHTVAIMEGDNGSAATILPLFFDECHITPYTTFMCHSASFGVSMANAVNVEANATFHAKQVKRFIRDAYKNFLEDGEILKILEGVEIYLDEFEIQERLEHRAQLLAQEADLDKTIKSSVVGQTKELKDVGLTTEEDVTGAEDILNPSSSERHESCFKVGDEVEITKEASATGMLDFVDGKRYWVVDSYTSVGLRGTKIVTIEMVRVEDESGRLHWYSCEHFKLKNKYSE